MVLCKPETDGLLAPANRNAASTLAWGIWNLLSSLERQIRIEWVFGARDSSWTRDSFYKRDSSQPKGNKLENIDIEIYFLYIDIFLHFGRNVCLKYRYVNLKSAISMQNCNYASIYKNFVSISIFGNKKPPFLKLCIDIRKKRFYIDT